MMKSISLLALIMFMTAGFALAGTTPGQETGLRKNFRKTPAHSITPEVTQIPEASAHKQANVGISETLSTPEAKQKLNSNSGNNLSGHTVGKQGLNRKGNGLSLGHFSLKNMWQSGKSLKNSHQSQFIQISITIFLFVTLLLLIGIMIGVLVDNLFIIFYIALGLLLVWTLLFMIGSLGLKKR
jgi:Flp pilus assembly protein TadB